MKDEEFNSMYPEDTGKAPVAQIITANGNCVTVNLKDGSIRTQNAERVVKLEFDEKTFFGLLRDYRLLEECIKQCKSITYPYRGEANGR